MSVDIRNPKFYAYVLIAIAMTAVILVLIYDERPDKPCFPPKGWMINSVSSSISSENVTLRIVGGEFAKYGEYPYLVSLQSYRGHHCGGGLIDKRHVLTAAHCVHGFLEHRLTIRAVVGTNNLRIGGTSYSVSRMTQHPDFSLGNAKNDVAVIRLERDVELSELVSFIKLPRPGQRYLYHGLELDVSGFGLTKNQGHVSDNLKKLTIYTCAYEICEYHYSDVRSRGQFCAMLAQGEGLCQGDSGSPVTINKKVVIGIVTGVSILGCASGVPDLITYVPDYLKFIEQEMKR